MKDFFRLFRFLRPHAGIFALAVVCMFASAVFDGVQIAPAIPMIDNVFSGKEIVFTRPLPAVLAGLIAKINAMPRLELLRIIVIGFLVVFSLKAISVFIREYLMTNVGQLIIRDVRNTLYAKYQDLSLDYYGKNKIGTLVSRITNDVGVINNTIAQGLTDVFYQSFKFMVLLSIAIFINWRLFLFSVVLFPFISVPVVRLSRALRKISTKSQEKMADLMGAIYEGISGIRIVKIFSMEDYEKNRFALANQGFYKITMKSAKRIIAIGPITELISSLAAMIILYVGGSQIIRGELSFGMFAAFMGSMFQCVQPVKRLSNITATMQQAAAAATRIFQILDAPVDIEDRPGAIELAEFKQSIVFDHVNFKYSGEKDDVLKNINLDVARGTILAIVGPSGVGKTTMVNLLGRFYDVTGGKITVDGNNISSLKVRSLRDKIGIVTQDMFLFNDTVKANIAYGNIEAEAESIVKAACAANANQFIQALPKGYDTIIGDRGFRLSGGEKQRLSIARALLKNPPILILDEATSQLDSQSEILVQEALEKLMRGRTVFVIAHRLSTIRRASKIIVLNKGTIAEQGSHEQLMQAEGLYKQLYQLQFRDV